LTKSDVTTLSTSIVDEIVLAILGDKKVEELQWSVPKRNLYLTFRFVSHWLNLQKTELKQTEKQLKFSEFNQVRWHHCPTLRCILLHIVCNHKSNRALQLEYKPLQCELVLISATSLRNMWWSKYS
jgi:hypothetical protein